VINELGFSKKGMVVVQNAVNTVRFCPVDDWLVRNLGQEVFAL